MNRNGLVQMMIITMFLMVMTYRRRRFFSKIHVLECDSAMEIQSFLFAKSKKSACGGHIGMLSSFMDQLSVEKKVPTSIHGPIICREKKGAHIYSLTNYLSRFTPRKKSISNNLIINRYAETTHKK